MTTITDGWYLAREGRSTGPVAGDLVWHPTLEGWNQTMGRGTDATSQATAQRQHDAIDRVRNDAELQGVTLSDEEVYQRASQLLDRGHGRGGPDGQLTAPAWASPDAIVNTIALERNLFANHVAVRVILPSGERLVLDVWEGLRDAAAGEVRPSISTEAEWLDRWARELRATFPGDGHIRLVTDHDETFTRLEGEYRQMYTDDTLLELQQRGFDAHRSGDPVHPTMGDAVRAELIDRGAPTARLGDERPLRQVAADSFARYGTTDQHLQHRLTIIDRVDTILAEDTIDRLVADTGINPDAAGDRTITHLLTDHLDEAPDPTEAEARHLAILAWLQDR